MANKLNLRERQQIYKWYRLHWSIRSISRTIGRAPSTVSRELIRNRAALELADDYFAQARYAHGLAHRRRRDSSARMRLKSQTIRNYIEAKIREGLSPELAAGRMHLKHPALSISYEAIYQWLYVEKRELIQFLPVAGKKRNHRASRRRYRFKQPPAPKVSIDERPEHINNRSQIGHWEGDLTAVSPRAKAAVLTLIERKTRLRLYSKVHNQQADTVARAIIETLKPLPPALRRSATFDNGSETACHPQIGQALNMNIYFCHPHQAPEKGQVEYANRNLRVFVPKSTPLSLVSDKRLAYAQNYWNDRPMKCLGFKTPHEAFLEELLLHVN